MLTMLRARKKTGNENRPTENRYWNRNRNTNKSSHKWRKERIIIFLHLGHCSYTCFNDARVFFPLIFFLISQFYFFNSYKYIHLYFCFSLPFLAWVVEINYAWHILRISNWMTNKSAEINELKRKLLRCTIAWVR